MYTEQKTILVIGGTGQQGGAVARHLLEDGWRVRTLTRNPAKPAAEALVRAGVEVRTGNIDDRQTLDEAMKGVHGVFSVTQFWEHGYEGEVRHGKAVADAAQKAGVTHFVYTSVGGADRGTGISHFESKWEVEEHIHLLGLPATVVRPVFFMENFNTGSAPIWVDGVWTVRVALRPDRSLQFIAVDDIGGIVALAFREPRGWIGQSIEIAGDELTIPRVAAMFSHSTGQPFAFEGVPIQDLERASPEAATMFRWFKEAGYQADIPAVRSLYPELTTFEAWLAKGGWKEPTKQREARVATG